MKSIAWVLGVVIVGFAAFFMLNNYIYSQKQHRQIAPMQNTETNTITVIPIAHASLALRWGKIVVYADPTGNKDAYAKVGTPDIILITHDHPDHLGTSTLTELVGANTKLIVTQSVAEVLPETLKPNIIVLKNGDETNQAGLSIKAIPAYNLREEDAHRHPQGKGNGYVLQGGGKRVYIAGDTEDIPEMRALQNIDIAFVPMNPPYTMTVEKAADAVLAFKPKQVYPYHYRTPTGLSDIARFKQLVNSGDQSIEVILANWYPEQ